MSYGLAMQASLWPSEATYLDGARYQEMANAIRPLLLELLRRERLDLALLEPYCRMILPLAAWLDHHRTAERTLVVGINGAQGAGKTTLRHLLEPTLRECFKLRVAGLSIDDLYRTHAERERLAHDVHPLLATRGVPGTHDVALGLDLLDRLTVRETAAVAIPAFDKARDDRRPQADWPVVETPLDLVLLDGWCVGARLQPDIALQAPINELEQRDDAGGTWRRHVNAQLAGDYAKLFARIDKLVMLKVPNMACVYEWRNLQEEKLEAAPGERHRIMDSSGLKRFVMHYERITRHTLEEMPERADLVLYLNEHHQFTSVHLNP
jgi:D-glycerate 3-kinase